MSGNSMHRLCLGSLSNPDVCGDPVETSMGTTSRTLKQTPTSYIPTNPYVKRRPNNSR